MGIWTVCFLHAGQEFISAVVIASSEEAARRMVYERDVPDILELSRRDWLSNEVAVCKHIGSANKEECQQILMFDRPGFLTKETKPLTQTGLT